MKSGMAGALGAIGLLVVAGPLNHVLNPRPVPAVSLPVWFTLPADAEVTQLTLTGDAGQEAASGSIDVAVHGDGTQALSELLQRLSARGFRIDDAASSVDVFMGASSVSTATDPVSGRRVKIVRIEVPAGTVLRLSYTDPAPLLARAE